MARVTVEDCLKNVESRFALVHLAVRRVLQLRGNAPPVIENTKANKEVVLALREIAASKITMENIRQIEEYRPVGAESAPPERASEAVELREILDEAISFNPSIQFDESEVILEPEPDQGQGQDEI